VAEYPGTAVEWDGRVYEVRDSIPAADGSIRYRLVPWDDRHAIRRVERYDAASEAAHEREQGDRRRDRGKLRLAILLAPLAGLLPRDVQKGMERDFGAPVNAMTIVSAVPLFLVGFLGIFRRLVGIAGGSVALPAFLAPSPGVAVYLFLWSAARLMSAIGSEEPLGDLMVELAYVAGRAVWKTSGDRP
jgi:hypothetical protein